MAIGDVLKPTGDMLGGSLGTLAQYSWVLFIFVFFAVLVGIAFLWKTLRDKKRQWTHKLKVRRVMANNLLSDPIYMNMRRFPVIKKAEVFELEKPLLGAYLMPELSEYSGENEFSIILDKNNRIYTNTGEYFNPDKASVNVSAKHSEIDIQRSNLKADFQNINKAQKRIEWATLAKYALWMVGIVCLMIVMINGFGKWGEAQTAKAQQAQSEAAAMASLAEAMTTVEATVNTQKLLIPELKELKGTENLQGLINNEI